jgi:hypothetical protein
VPAAAAIAPTLPEEPIFGQGGGLFDTTESGGLALDQTPGSKVLLGYEGSELVVYRDSVRNIDFPEGRETVGKGHLVVPGDNLKEGDIISKARETQLYNQDLKEALKFTKTFLKEVGRHPPEAEAIFTRMIFQMGLGVDKDPKKKGIFGFHKMMKALKNQDYKTVADEMLKSDWATRDSPARAKEEADRMRALAIELPPHERPREKPTMLPAIDEAAPDEAAPHEKFKGQLRLKAGSLGFAVNAPPASYIESPLPLDAVSFEAPKVPSQLGAVPALMESASVNPLLSNIPSTINEPSAAQLLPNAPGPGQLHEPAVQTPPVARAVASADPSLPEARPRVAPQLPGDDGDLGYLLDGPDKAPKTESEILKFLKRPETTAALLQFAINVLQPLGPGQSTIGAIASALGAGGKAYGRVVDKRAAAEKGAREEARDQQIIDIAGRDTAGSARIEESKFKATQQKAANDLYESLQSAGLEALSYSMEDVTPAAREALARRSAQQVAKMYPDFGYEPIINDQSTLGLLYSGGRLLATLQNPKSREALLARLDVDEDILAAFLAEMGLVDPSLPTSGKPPSAAVDPDITAIIASAAEREGPALAGGVRRRASRQVRAAEIAKRPQFPNVFTDKSEAFWQELMRRGNADVRAAIEQKFPEEFKRLLGEPETVPFPGA